MMSLHNLRQKLEKHRFFALLWMSLGMTRLLAVPLLAPGGFVAELGPDQYYYWQFAGLTTAGYWPYLNFWMEYPPVFPFLAALAYQASLLLPAWENPFLLFHVALHWSLVPFDLANLYLLYRIALHLHDQRTAETVTMLYAVSFVPLFIFLTWFDSLTLFFLLLGLWGLVSGNAAVSGLGVGLGFLTKMLPVVIAPAALMRFRRWPRWAWFAGIAGGLVVLILGTLLYVSPEHTLATFQALGSRAPWETIWALLDGIIQFGEVAPLSARVNPASAVGEPFQSGLPWQLITLVFGALGLWLWIQRIDWGEPKRSVAFVGLTLTLTMLYSKGYSPQWALYLVAMAILVLPGWCGVVYTLLYALLLVAEWPIAYYVFTNAPWVAVAVICVRTVVTTALAVNFAAQVYPHAGQLQRVARHALPVATEITVITAVALAPGMVHAYHRIRLANDTLAPLVSAAQPGDLIVTPHVDAAARVGPLVRTIVEVQVFPQVNGTAWEDVDEWLGSTTSGYERVWLVTREDDLLTQEITYQLRDWLGDGRCLAEAWETEDRLSVHAYETCPPSEE